MNPKGILFFSLTYLVFFLSGAAALVYQVSWSRQIGLSFGHTIHAAALTLAGFFAGNAIGYLAGSRLSGRVDPLLGYGAAELIAAAWACAIPALLRWSDSAAILNFADFRLQTAARAVYCTMLLLPATIALGFTLPMMADALALRTGGRPSDAANMRRISFAYSLNTAGALAAVLATTYFLLIVVGVTASSYFAAALSTLCATIAIAMYFVRANAELPSLELRDATQLVDHGKGWIWAGLAALSGFGMLALEVLYTRMFALVFHNSTYTFGAVVAVFLAALAAGAALAGTLQSRFRAETLLATATGLGGAAIVASTIVFVGLTRLEYFQYGASFAQYVGGATALTFLVVFPPVTLLGMTLPLTWKAAGYGRAAGAVVGRLTAVNTLAAAAGALIASFLLLPGIGLWASFILVASTFSAFGCVSFLLSKRLVSAFIGAATFAALVAGAWGAASWAGSRLQNDERIVRRWNSAYGWIDLIQDEDSGTFRVRQNLHYRFGRTGANRREFKLAHIPLLLHERPDEALFLGLGTGLTAGGAMPHEDVKSVVAVELIPEVVEAADALAEHNNRVTSHPKAEIRIDDARHYLLTTDRRFDVIIADLFVPWESETGYLYTVEHYRIAKDRLKPGGLYCQWLPLYQVGSSEFEMILDSFSSVFPAVTLWWGDMNSSSPIVAIVGADHALEIDHDRLQERLDALRRNAGSLDESLRTPERFFDAYIGDWPVRREAVLNTDEHPRVEFSTPISNRDRAMLQGRALRDYFQAVLRELPSGGAALFRDGTEIGDSDDARRNRQRFVLGFAIDE